MFGFVRLFLVFYTSSLCDSCRLAGGLFFRFFPVPASGSPDGDAVDFDITVQLDNETLSAVDQLRVDEIRALRIDLNDHIRCLDLETAASMNPAIPPLFCTSAIICKVTVVLPLDSGP